MMLMRKAKLLPNIAPPATGFNRILKSMCVMPTPRQPPHPTRAPHQYAFAAAVENPCRLLQC